MTQPPNQPPAWWHPPASAQPHSPHGYSASAPLGYSSGAGDGFQSQYGGLGAFDQKSPKKPKRSTKLIIAGISVVILVAGGVTTAVLLGLFNGDVLNQEAVEDGVATVLRESYGEYDVSQVQCPDGQEIVSGHTFDCTVNIAGKQKTVAIRVLNDEPEYEVGAPQ